MTPEERAVIEAARAHAARVIEVYGPVAEYPHMTKTARDLCAAVAALPVPLAERLPGLRPGAVVRVGGWANAGVVMANDPAAEQLWLRIKGDCTNTTMYYNCITSIVSEAPDA